MTIRRVPEDFIVEEELVEGFLRELRPRPASPGDGAVYLLTKTSLTTPDAARDLARRLGVKTPDVTYAGLKDRHARTTQHVRVALRTPGPAMPEIIEGASWRAERLGYTSAPLDAGCIARNRFTIVVRGLTLAEARAMQSRARALAADSADLSRSSDALLIANYFGAQRFGSARHGQGWIAEALLRGDFERALRLAIGTPSRKDTGATRAFTRLCAERWGEWASLARDLPRLPERLAIERLSRGAGFRDAFTSLPYFLQMMSVEAYQSLLWNETLRGMIRSHATAAGGGPLRADDEYGEMLFPRASTLPDAWLDLSIPTPAPGMRCEEPWGAHVLEAITCRGLTLEALRIPGLRRPFFGEAQRSAFVRASSFALSSDTRDEMSTDPHARRCSVSFSLPRGAYATVVLRALGQ